MYQRGVIHLLPLLFIAVALIAIYLAASGNLKIPSLFKQQPKVELKTSYENPFDKETQYVNPFENYKNPFVVNR